MEHEPMLRGAWGDAACWVKGGGVGLVVLGMDVGRLALWGGGLFLGGDGGFRKGVCVGVLCGSWFFCRKNRLLALQFLEKSVHLHRQNEI